MLREVLTVLSLPLPFAYAVGVEELHGGRIIGRLVIVVLGWMGLSWGAGLG